MAESRGLDRSQYEDSEWSAAIELVGLSNPAIHRSPTSAAAAAASEVSAKYEEVKSVPNGPGEANAFKKPDAIVPCPRCNSMETKFCYFNNYNKNQPRHFCRTCKRYWTVGGAMRDVPEGSGRRWNKQPSNSRHATKPSNGDVLDTPHCLSRIVKPPVVPSWTNGVWGSPWSGSSVTTLPSLPPNNVAYPGGDYLALGKHPREANLQEEAEAEKTFWVPKALRVTNPEEVAKCSIWDSLGIKPDERLLFWKC